MANQLKTTKAFDTELQDALATLKSQGRLTAAEANRILTEMFDAFKAEMLEEISERFGEDTPAATKHQPHTPAQLATLSQAFKANK
jgi:hypothetical protein